MESGALIFSVLKKNLPLDVIQYILYSFIYYKNQKLNEIYSLANTYHNQNYYMYNSIHKIYNDGEIIQMIAGRLYSESSIYPPLRYTFNAKLFPEKSYSWGYSVVTIDAATTIRNKMIEYIKYTKQQSI